MTTFINPARGIMGRLFLWFWATFIVTALLAFWGSRLFFHELQIEALDPKERAVLSDTRDRILSKRNATLSLETILRRGSRGVKGRLLAIELDSKRVVVGGGPRLRENDKEDLDRLLSQTSPISIKRGAIKTTGPLSFERNNQRYALFIMRIEGPNDTVPPYALFLGIALITTSLLSWLFAKSLTGPILRIQKSANHLANGDWSTRVLHAETRHDELGQLARDFNRMAEQLEQMWGAQKRLLADVSHELRSPLARLQMALGLAHQQNIDPVTLSRIEREAERMEALISHLLTLSRAEAGDASFTIVSLPTVLHDVFTDASFEAANKHKQLNIGDVPDISVNVDTIMLCRAVENVLRNAIRHSNTRVDVNVEASEHHWVIHIIDDGEGLSVDECERVFSPFYRASLARERASGGVGLGLSIAKAAVELHDGKIIAAPGDKGGLKVLLSFPMQ
ncbi:ATP-binding protein [Alteromonas sp.]|nr:ATP-binding protein [Alteromonas sp.]